MTQSTNIHQPDPEDSDQLHPIKLNIYDLSQGLASQFSLAILGIHLKAVYHTSITVYNKEFYFNSMGIQQHSPPLTTHFGKPIEVRDMGGTYIPEMVFQEFVNDLDEFKSGKYDVFMNNCNDFTRISLEFLNDQVLDEEISGMSKRVLASEKGEMVRQWLMGYMG